MRTGMKLVAWVLAVVAAGAIVGGAYLAGVDRGLFAPGREDEVGRLLLADEEAQRAIAEASVDSLIQQVPLLEAARPSLEDAATRVTRSDRYAEVFQSAVDLAYERALARGPSAKRSVVLTLDDIVALLGDDSIPLLAGVDLGAGLGDRGVELLGARELQRLRQVQDAAHRWALPLLSLGVVLAIASLVVPGGRSARTVGLGAMISVGAAVMYFSTNAVGARLAARSVEPAAAVVDALWVSAVPSVRAWLGGVFMAGLLVIVAGVLINAEHD